MEDFLAPVFKFMEGNFILLNMFILYGLPTLVCIIGVVLQLGQSKLLHIIGILLILMSIASCFLLSIYTLIQGLITTGLAGLVWTGVLFYFSFSDAKDKNNDIGLNEQSLPPDGILQDKKEQSEED
jgi:hypothetical protein